MATSPEIQRPQEQEWRRAILLSLPMAGIAFLAGALLDGPSHQGNAFDRISYPLLTLGVVVLEVLLWRIPTAVNRVVTALVVCMSVFFLSKLIYILNFMPDSLSVQAEMTESFFWIPALYVLSFFIPNLKLARLSSGLFFYSVLLVSLQHILTHPLAYPNAGVAFALLELNFANLTLLSLTGTFIGFKERFARREAQSDTLQRLAYSDLLTGLPNRLALEDALAQVTRDATPYSVLFIDIDGFKLVNDTVGHGAGDLVLKEVSQRLSAVLKEGELIARLSGDEFVVLVSGPDADRPMHTAQRVLTELTRPYQTQGQVFYLTASIGVSRFPDDAQDAPTLLKHADSAMYHVKSRSKNGVRRFEVALDTEIERQKALEHEFHFALEREQFELYYQPIYTLKDGGLRKVEALLRWTHPTYGSVPPTVFVSLAEANGQIIPLGAWVLHQACRQARVWANLTGKPLIMSVNVSPVQFAQPGFVNSVKQALVESGLASEQLELELTEGAVIRNLQAVQLALVELRQFGVRVAIDDFGTGYSSLSYLKDLPISCIKIDRSFIADLGQPRRAPQYALALVEAIVGIAGTLDLEVVAEGIETAAQQSLLLDLGCQLGQGYLYSRPVTAAQIQLMLGVSREADPSGHVHYN